MGVPYKHRNDPARRQAPPKDPRPFPWRKLLSVVGWTLGLFVFHLAAVEVAVFGKAVSIAVFWFYYAAALILVVAYIVVNRGFTRASWTMENLSPKLSDDEKRRLLDERDEWKRKSAFMIPILFGLAVTFFFEIVSLFFAEPLEELFTFLNGLLPNV